MIFNIIHNKYYYYFFYSGFDGGMEQFFLVTVSDRTTGESAYNHTTTKLDLLVTNLSAGSSYLVYLLIL